MAESPEVAIIQHASGVMQVVHNLFENASMYPRTEFLGDIYLNVI
jgi:hypothetical protein